MQYTKIYIAMCIVCMCKSGLREQKYNLTCPSAKAGLPESPKNNHLLWSSSVQIYKTHYCYILYEQLSPYLQFLYHYILEVKTCSSDSNIVTLDLRPSDPYSMVASAWVTKTNLHVVVTNNHALRSINLRPASLIHCEPLGVVVDHTHFYIQCSGSNHPWIHSP